MSRLLRVAIACSLVACNAGFKIDPEGYRCDPNQVCPTGFQCVNDVCVNSATFDAGTCGPDRCLTVAPTCVSNTQLRSTVSQCVNNTCQYETIDTACPLSCAAGACVGECQNALCTRPPASVCLDTQRLKIFETQGQCSGAVCVYPSREMICTGTCEAGRCRQQDMCLGVVCNQPPIPTCEGNQRVTYGSPGTCNTTNGRCDYVVASRSTCPNGCAVGQCLTASVTWSQFGPQIPFPISAIDIAPGSMGNLVVAVGPAGEASWWNGSNWSALQTSTSERFNAVSFVTGAVAYAVGNNGAAIRIDFSGSATVSTVSDINTFYDLIAVSGRSEQEILVASDSGDWWRAKAGVWSSGWLPLTSSYEITGAYLDESLRERLVGLCHGSTTRQCVLYRNLNIAGSDFLPDYQTGTQAFRAVGGSFSVPNSAKSVALIGRPTSTLFEHDNLGAFSGLTITPSLTGGAIIAITADSSTSDRQIYVLTEGSSTTPGSLQKIYRGFAGVGSFEVTSTQPGAEIHLSSHESNGVLLAQVSTGIKSNAVMHLDGSKKLALELNGDWVGASYTPTGSLVVATERMIATRSSLLSGRFEVTEPPSTLRIHALEANRGANPLVVGADGSTGFVAQLSATGISNIGSTANPLTDVCRVSDSEAWAVGRNGELIQIANGQITLTSSGTTEHLQAVDCVAGRAIACGARQTVLWFENNTWSALTQFPMNGDLTMCVMSGDIAYVGNAQLLYSYKPGTGWSALPTVTGLHALHAKTTNELYGAFSVTGGSEIRRFDGAAWSGPLLKVPGTLRGNSQFNQSVVWGGTLGTLIEGH